MLLDCYPANNDYQQDLFQINHLVNYIKFRQKIVLKTYNLKSSFIRVWFTDEYNNLLEMENSTNLTLVISLL